MLKATMAKAEPGDSILKKHNAAQAEYDRLAALV